jgi:RHS repeat-associated protein
MPLPDNCTSVTAGTSVTSIAYDYENRVVGITYPSAATNSFSYNGNDLRMQKVDSAGTANYLCDGTTPASAVLKDGAAVYTPGLSERRGTTSKFYHADALGSTRGITDAGQAVTDSVLYDGFGMVVSRTGTTPTPFGFVGKGQYQTDNDSGLQLLGHRYYDASVGRFISSDPAKAGDNWYAYCSNNPLQRTDPLGLEEITLPPVDKSPGPGWREENKKDPGTHQDPRSRRWIRGDDALDATTGKERATGWEGRDHWHRYRRQGNGVFGPKDASQGKGGHLTPGQTVRVNDPIYVNPGLCNPGGYCPPTEAYYPPPPYFDWHWALGGVIIVGGAIIIGATGQVEVGGPIIYGGLRMAGAGN